MLEKQSDSIAIFQIVVGVRYHSLPTPKKQRMNEDKPCTLGENRSMRCLLFEKNNLVSSFVGKTVVASKNSINNSITPS